MGRRAGGLSRLAALIIVLLLGREAFASPSSLGIRQAWLDYPSLTVYADLLDREGAPRDLSDTEDLSASLGGVPLALSQVRRYSAVDDGLLILFAIDTSASVGGERFVELQQAVSDWIRRLGPRDRASVISFGEGVSLAQGFTAEQNALLYAVQSLSPEDERADLNLAVLRALELARTRSAGLPGRRIIVLCSDGFRVSTGSATAEEVRSALAVDPIPIYSVLFDSPERESANRKIAAQQLLNELGYDAGPVDGKLGPRTTAAIRVFQQSRGVAWDGRVSSELIGVLRTMAKNEKDSALSVIGEFSRRSGGELYRTGTSHFNQVFDTVASSLDQALVLVTELSETGPESTVKRLELSCSEGDRTLMDGVDIRLVLAPAPSTPVVPETDEPGSFVWGSVFVAVGVILLVVAGFVYVKRRGSGDRKSAAALNETAQTRLLSGAPAARVELTPFDANYTGPPLKAEIRDRLVLGRRVAPSVLVVPGDATISAKHCELQYTDGKLLVRDLDSSNGTMVNGVPIETSYPIEDGDRLTLGKTELRIRIIGVS
ncbi:MAG: FHA domain-containing protein [Synergistaceae bacterium]|nr:FHA domain-containing protein [Synergistaceae bacterium]